MAAEIITKTCRTCKQTKPISEFFKRPDNRDNHDSQCKTCSVRYNKQYRQTKKGKQNKRRWDYEYYHSEKGQETRKQYLQSEKGKESEKRYRESERCKNTRKKYMQTENFKISERNGQKRFHLRHPNQRKARYAVRQAIKEGKLPKPNSLQCLCGKQAVQYHHHKDYAPEFWLDVIPVCIDCHKLTFWSK